MLLFFPRGVLDEILNLIESVSEGFPFYIFIHVSTIKGFHCTNFKPFIIPSDIYTVEKGS